MNETQLLVLAAGVALVVVIRSLIFHKWSDVFWRGLADATRLTYHRRGIVNDPCLTGTYHDFSLTVDNFTGYSRGLREYVRVRVHLTNPTGVQFMLNEAGSKGPSFWEPAGQRISLADPEFDRRFDLTSRLALPVAEYFPQALRQAWSRLKPFDLKVEANGLQFRHVGLEITPAEVVVILNLITELAHILDSRALISRPRP